MLKKVAIVGGLVLAMSCPGKPINIDEIASQESTLIQQYTAQLQMLEEMERYMPVYRNRNLYQGPFPIAGPRVYATWKIFETYTPNGKLINSTEALFIDDYVSNTRIAMNDYPKTEKVIDSGRLIDIPTGEIVKEFAPDELDELTQMYKIFLEWIVQESDPEKEMRKDRLEV
jgi:hypothetical protein